MAAFLPHFRCEDASLLKLMRAYPAWTLVALFFLLFVFGVNIATLYTDWLWFGEVGQQAVLGKILSTRLLLFLVFGAAAFTLAYLNLHLAERFSPPLGISLPGEGPSGGDVFVFDREGRPRRATVNGRVIRTLSGLRRVLAVALLLGTLLFALVSGLSASSEWDSFLRFRHGVRWGDSDALFRRDIGFYVFTLPFLRYVQGWLLVVLLVIGAAVALLYFFQRGIDTAAGRTIIAPHVRAHLSALVALALLTLAFGYWLDRFDLLYAGGKAFSGAGYTDANARLPALNLLMGVTVLAALAVLINIRQRSLTLPAAALLLWLASWFGVGVLYPGFIQATRVRPNEASYEKPYIQRAIAATRRAYGLDGVVRRDFPAEPSLAATDLAKNQMTLRNIRLWDYEPLRETYPQQQGLRQYYAFPDVDVDRYRLGTDYRQVWLAAREIAPEQLAPSAQTWPNLRLKYTHGFGVVMSPVNEFTGQGLPTFFLKDIPPVSTVPGLAVTQPRIYYGQGAPRGSYVVVGTRQPEFDYHSDSGTASASQERVNAYQGRGGVRLGPLAKFAFSWRFRDPTLLLSRDVTSVSRLLFARQVSVRVRRVAPFLRLDRDPYPVLVDGRIVWVVDAYTTTSAYPYAAPVEVRDSNGVPDRLNYLRNAVKATVDAYDGTVTLYAVDERDPILQTYRRIFPRLMRPLAEMPAGLRTHLRYPEDLFSIQRSILADYHVEDPGVFYARTDAWQVARERRDVEADSPVPFRSAEMGVMEPYYAIMRLPEEKDEEFLLLSPFTPRGKGNMIAWLAARCDGEQYGQLVLYRFPADRLVPGPEQIGTRIRQDSQISPQLSLWNQQGSRVLLGNMLVVPIEKSLLYVQPLYLKAQTQAAGDGGQSGAIPELKRVIVAFENQIVMAETLEDALGRLFGEAAPAQPRTVTSPQGRPAPASAAALIGQARAQYDRAQAALKGGDFAAYGREVKALGETLRQMEVRQKGAAR